MLLSIIVQLLHCVFYRGHLGSSRIIMQAEIFMPVIFSCLVDSGLLHIANSCAKSCSSDNFHCLNLHCFQEIIFSEQDN